jgi:FG-GAP-like repeat
MLKKPVFSGAFKGVALFSCVVVFSCKQYSRNQSHAQVPTASIRQGEQLARTYCGSCHLVPDPSQLDSRSWEKGVLPAMGPRLGIFNFGFEAYPNSQRDTNLSKNFYPSQPLLKPEEWGHILDYYSATSPDSLPGQVRSRPIDMKGLSLFSVSVPAFRYPVPATTLVRIDTSVDGAAGGAVVRGGLMLFDNHYHNLFRVSPSLQLVDSLHDSGGIVDIERQGAGWTACNIGILGPNNGKSGRLQTIHSGPDGKWQLDSMALFGHLARPVQATAVDINGDGRTDWLVCEFGNLTGALSWLENKGDSGFVRHIIRAVPGPIRAYINDYNHDGLPDIWAMFAQGDEGIFLFTNQGKGQFSQQTLLRFPPSYGSSSFELDDFNKDGYPDILYTCGDNADFSPVLKPYHGVYIYENDGQNHFTQRYFYPINGCFKAMARDFDGDGDLDIATISFFPDFSRQPEEGFVYLENLGGYDFRPYSLPETEQGKWLTMDVGDVDGDGKPDIVLGNFSYAPVTKAGVDFKKGPPFMVLRNVGK